MSPVPKLPPLRRGYDGRVTFGHFPTAKGPVIIREEGAPNGEPRARLQVPDECTLCPEEAQRLIRCLQGFIRAADAGELSETVSL